MAGAGTVVGREVLVLPQPDGLLDIRELVLGPSDPPAEDGGVVDLARHGIEVVDRRILGSGGFNDVYACLLKGRSGTAARRIAVKPLKPQLYRGKPTTIQQGVGIDHAEPRLACRNIATSVLDGAIGTAIVPKTAAILIDGQPFLAMTIAPGTSAGTYYRRDPGIVLDPAFQRRCNDLEVLAYLSGNPDNGSRNILISATGCGASRTDVRVTLIDHDLAFGPNVDNPDRMAHIAGSNKRQYQHTGLPAYVDINTASRLRTMDRRATVGALRRFLTARELDAFEGRLGLMLDHIDDLKRMRRVVFDWGRFVDVVDRPLDGGDYLGGTLDFAGVLQGRLGEEDHHSPRSVILRDCLEGLLGNDAALDALLGRERRERLQGWSTSVKKHVPPSGVDHR